jgi:FkbM family methyltransferase
MKKKVSNLLSYLSRSERKLYCNLSYSQCGEDLIVDFIFRTIGINNPSYIDIGAHHPFRFNNTKIFYDRGCRGINIEPDPFLFSSIKKHRRFDVNLNIGVSNVSTKLIFNIMSAPTMNTFSLEEAENLVKKFGFFIKNRVEVPVETIKDIIQDHHNSVFPDFLSIDVEGMDFIILKSIDFNNGPIVICAETLSYEQDGTGVKNQEIIDYLLLKDYMVYADTHINTIFVKRNKWIKS